jgi:integrase
MRDRHGIVKYYYFRRNGRRWRLPGEPTSEEFQAEYRALVAATEPAQPSRPAGYAPGTLGALVIDYFASAKFMNLRPSSQKMYRLVLKPLVERHGHKPIRSLQRHNIMQWHSVYHGTRGKANMVVRVVRVLLNFAIDTGRYGIDQNPALRIEQYKLGEHRAWTDEERAAFEKRWAPGTMQRRAYALALFTGQRCGDLAKMTRAHRKDGHIRVVQQKTGTELEIREHRELTAELALGSKDISLLTRIKGGTFDSDGLSVWFAAAIEQAGLPVACKMHGLRKTACKKLAEVGCSAFEIASITGHKSLKVLEGYVTAANKTVMGEAAILKWEQNANRTASAKRPPPPSAKQKPRG